MVKYRNKYAICTCIRRVTLYDGGYVFVKKNDQEHVANDTVCT
jgi:hypothetical protein